MYELITKQHQELGEITEIRRDEDIYVQFEPFTNIFCQVYCNSTTIDFDEFVQKTAPRFRPKKMHCALYCQDPLGSDVQEKMDVIVKKVEQTAGINLYHEFEHEEYELTSHRYYYVKYRKSPDSDFYEGVGIPLQAKDYPKWIIKKLFGKSNSPYNNKSQVDDPRFLINSFIENHQKWSKMDEKSWGWKRTSHLAGIFPMYLNGHFHTMTEREGLFIHFREESPEQAYDHFAYLLGLRSTRTIVQDPWKVHIPEIKEGLR